MFIKKNILKILIVGLIGAVLVAGAFYFTSLPYLPINRLLASSPEISGHVTGSVLSGVRITNLVVRGAPEGEISVKDIVFRYNGLEYLLRGRLVITTVAWQGVKADLPKGNFTNWAQIQRQFEDRLYLIPPVPKKSLSLIEIKNLSVRDIDIKLGENPVPTMASNAMMLPILMMTSRMLGQGPAAPGFPSGGMPPEMTGPPKTEKKFLVFRLHNFEVANSRFESFASKKPAVLNLFKISNLIIEKQKFDLGRLEIQSDTLGLAMAKSSQSGDGWENLVVDINGAIKQEAAEGLKKDIEFSGRVADRQLDLSAFDGKVTFKAGMPSGSFLPSAELRVAGVDLPDYFTDIAPLTNINTSFQTGGLFAGRDLTMIVFNLGAGRFEGSFMKRSPMKQKGVPQNIISAQLSQSRDISAVVSLDAEIQGNLRVELRQNPPRMGQKHLLSRVWYGKNFATLNPNELAFLKTISVYFGIEPREFTAVAKTKPKPRGTRRRR